jgi:hypothetical protein
MMEVMAAMRVAAGPGDGCGRHERADDECAQDHQRRQRSERSPRGSRGHERAPVDQLAEALV